MLWFLKPKPPPAPSPPDAHVVPCTGIDLGPRRMVVTTGLIIDAKLDAEKLESTLKQLVVHKFPRAGARLALRNDVWEFHVPHKFDDATPPLVFTYENHSAVYASPSRPKLEHIRASSATAPFVCELPNLGSFLRSPTCPSTTDGFLAPNTPLLHIHASIFDDLTLLGVTSTHILFDAIGTSELLRAWTRLLNGDALEDIPGMLRDLEPFKPLVSLTAKKTKMPHIRGWYKLGIFGTISFLVRFMWRLYREPNEEAKLVRVPKAFLEGKKKEVMGELVAKGSDEWVGSSDVLLAWWYKTSYSHRNDSTPLHIHVPVNLRDTPIFQDDSSRGLAPLSIPYINNAVASIAIPPVPVRTLVASPLHETALHLRRAITAYHANPSGIAADMRWRCSHPLRALFPCPPGAEYAVQTSWRVAKFAKLDWTGAVTELDRKTRPQVVAVIPMMTSNRQRPMRGGGAVLMEDENAVWMSQVSSLSDWEAVRRGGVVQFLDV